MKCSRFLSHGTPLRPARLKPFFRRQEAVCVRHGPSAWWRAAHSCELFSSKRGYASRDVAQKHAIPRKIADSVSTFRKTVSRILCQKATKILTGRTWREPQLCKLRVYLGTGFASAELIFHFVDLNAETQLASYLCRPLRRTPRTNKRLIAPGRCISESLRAGGFGGLSAQPRQPSAP